MRVAFIADELTNFIKNHDSTWAIMQAAFDDGIKVFYAHAGSLGIEAEQVYAQFVELDENFFTYQRQNPEALVKFPSSQKYLATKIYLDDFPLVFMRKDPPVDPRYLHEVQLLSLCKKALVTNKPESLLLHNEKLSILNFPDLIAPTTVTNNMLEAQDFVQKHGKTVLKPLDGKGGEGIIVLQAGDKNLKSLLELTMNSRSGLNSKLVMLQKYIPEIETEGDKRIVMINGMVRGALLRIPPENDHRGNMASGGSFVEYQPSVKDLQICNHISNFLEVNGMHLAGIDIIGDCLTEINITSPTCLQEINRFNPNAEKLERILLRELKAKL